MQPNEIPDQSYTTTWSGGRDTLVYSGRDWSHPAERDRVARQLDVEAITVAGTGHFSALERRTEMVRIIRQSAGRTVGS